MVKAKSKGKKTKVQKKNVKVAAKKVIKKAVKMVKKTNGGKVPKLKKVEGGYSEAQRKEYKEWETKFNGYSNQQLKDLLRANMQSMSGTKGELVAKCADGAVLGRIPRCPQCFGGRPKFDEKKKNYYCSGFRDDVDFKNCHTTFTMDQIIRTKWEM